MMVVTSRKVTVSEAAALRITARDFVSVLVTTEEYLMVAMAAPVIGNVNCSEYNTNQREIKEQGNEVGDLSSIPKRALDFGPRHGSNAGRSNEQEKHRVKFLRKSLVCRKPLIQRHKQNHIVSQSNSKEKNRTLSEPHRCAKQSPHKIPNNGEMYDDPWGEEEVDANWVIVLAPNRFEVENGFESVDGSDNAEKRDGYEPED
nr:hypothetical protein Iba_chr02eCG12020 [Ipomoea batatas]